MKALNAMVFVSDAAEEVAKIKDRIKAAEDFGAAEAAFRHMAGYIDALNTFNNAMVCLENNDFTGDFGDVIDNWMRKAWQALIDKAAETGQSKDVIQKLLEKRDEIR